MRHKRLGYAALLGIAFMLLGACQTLEHASGASPPPYQEPAGGGGNGGGGGY